MSVKSSRRSYNSPSRAAAADETRARIIAAARTLLAGGKNLPPFSLDGVARKAGVTRLTVYNQFESKHGLLEAVFDDLAQEGGLMDLRAVFADPDADRALRRFVSVFCRFWSAYASALSRFAAVAKLDDEVAAILKQRMERRRQGLTVLVSRMLPAGGKASTDLVDVLYALSSLDTFAALSVRNRSARSVELLLWDLVASTVARFRAAAG